MRVLVLGGYGLIGTEVVKRLSAVGFTVTGLGRSVRAVQLRNPDVSWIAHDIASLVLPDRWLPLIRGFDAVVNCAGALQDGARDNLQALQADAMMALFSACESAGVTHVIQISAVGADPKSATDFMRTKAEADAALRASALRWTILKPGLVIAPTAYGATALLRALAAFPMAIPIVGGWHRIQTVGVGDVAEAVLQVLDGQVPDRRDYDLVEERQRSLADLVTAFRAWLGLPPAPVIAVPRWIGSMVMRLGDGLGRLGWRTPLRTTTLAQLDASIVGDPEPWAKAGGSRVDPLERVLGRLPSTVQERWFARLWLLKPAILVGLSLFWVLTGAIALYQVEDATRVLTSRGLGDGAAHAIVVFGAMLDIALGAALLVRPLLRPAALGMVVVTAGYLVGGTLLAPDLWLDPLGAYLKTIPGLLLALVAASLAEER